MEPLQGKIHFILKFQSKTNCSENDEYERERKYLRVSVENGRKFSTAVAYVYDTPNIYKTYFHTSMSLSPLTTSRCKPGGGFPALENKERKI